MGELRSWFNWLPQTGSRRTRLACRRYPLRGGVREMVPVPSGLAALNLRRENLGVIGRWTEADSHDPD